MDKRKRQPTGSLKISQEVVATIATVATMEVDGVASLADASPRFNRFFHRSGGKKSIDINLTDDFAEIDIGLNLTFGANIPEVCSRVQTNVKDNVQTMTGLAVSKVNLVIEGIEFPGETAGQEA